MSEDNHWPLSKDTAGTEQTQCMNCHRVASLEDVRDIDVDEKGNIQSWCLECLESYYWERGITADEPPITEDGTR